VIRCGAGPVAAAAVAAAAAAVAVAAVAAAAVCPCKLSGVAPAMVVQVPIEPHHQSIMIGDITTNE